MRILIVSQYFWPENFGINQVAKDLAAKGHSVDVLTGMPNYPDGIFYKKYGGLKWKKENWMEINIFRTPIFPRGSKKVLNFFMNYISFIISAIVFAPLMLRGRKYDTIFIYGVSPIFQAIPAILLGKIKKAPVVLWVQDLWPESVSATGYIKSSFILKILSFFVVLTYNRCDLILAQSKSFVGYIAHLTSRKVIFFPNSIDKSFYAKSPSLPLLKDSPLFGNHFTIVYAGNVGKAQAIDILVDAAKELNKYPKIKFIIFGSGNQIGWVKEQKKKFVLNNLILGGVYPIEAMPSLLSNASILFLSLKKSKIFEMTIPNKLQAYLAIGKPILGSVSGESAKIIKLSKAGLSVEPENLKELIAAIKILYNMSEHDLNKFGINGKRYFKNNFESSLLIDKLESIFMKFKKNER